MSKKNIESFIAKAITILQSEFKNGEIPSAYNGYISSFGASVIQSGLKATIALFENKNASTKEDKNYLLKLIAKVLEIKEKNLMTYVLENDNNITKQQILDAAVALKLSIRTFQLKKD
ncbi:type III-B CRISPR module-associated protein Cmr5 [Sulfurimonas sp. SWIR-19]|uniref:type III-B CRISPR module-associated protein Cmr5 n=1 Tax=Sulfurimonas sp. SWIR-19 TaxID=2878390 RepID=UPI001CF1AD4A|nr:type III-B CRISPR module-associated protein Cmr5 [Sulfurimonas sp. SWIR-19]UCN01256.1 type III-B CRISPR module-associated protein Cmr5 [Sulfurimonas sp. SWIR-19]